MSTDTVSTDTAPARPRVGYLGLWRTLPRELLYLLFAFPIAIAGFVLTITLFSVGIGTLPVFLIGVVLVIGCLYTARGFGTVELALLEASGRPPISRPDWQDAQARAGFFGWLRAVLGNGHYWLYMLHVMLIDFILKTITWTITVIWVSVGLGGVTYWFSELFPRDGESGRWFLSLRIWPGAQNPELLDTLLYLGVGILFLATLPFVTRGLVTLHWLVARGLLGSWRSDALQREVTSLNESRGAAQSAEGHSLRRLERDIHDGPQQRLVRLQMDLAAADRQLDQDPSKARELLAEAMQQSKDALEELRALSRGFAPPILLDRGLVAALESAAVRSTVPTRVTSELPAGARLPQEIERNAYFIASEALANAAKHSGATEVEVTVAVSGDGWLDVSVTDDGIGGAVALAGHGLAGLDERLRGLGGTFEVHSPTGGPTTVTAHLPLPTVTASSPAP